jgi:hypothetical protein
MAAFSNANPLAKLDDDENESGEEVEEVIEKKDDKGIADQLKQCLMGLSVFKSDLERKNRFIECAVEELVSLWDFSKNTSSSRSLLNKPSSSNSVPA